uniref:Uncharacterized protein n=1 Tax=viral metagenome TaxID=1070528 RepID=A0A6M3KJ79_9ZZZZ
MSGDMYLEGLKGVGPIPPAQGIYQESSVQMAPLGTRVAFSDGRVFRYAKASGVALAAGKVVGPRFPALDTNKNVETTAAIGSYAITVSTAAARTTATEGFVVINDQTGEGLMYKIKAAVAGTTTTSTNFTLYDPIATATVGGTTEATVLNNPYLDLVVTANITDEPVGVPPIAVTASYYFWVQTWGICPALMDDAIIGGTLLTISTTDGAVTRAGASAGSTTFANAIIGRKYSGPGVSTEYNPIYLMLAP